MGVREQLDEKGASSSSEWVRQVVMRKCVLRVVEGGCHEKNCRKRILSSRKNKAQGPEAGEGVVRRQRKRPVWPAPEWARWGNQ